MSIQYEKGSVTISVEGIEEVQKALGELGAKTPAVTKVAVNRTARYARKLMIQKAKARYAVNAAGKKHLNDLVQRKKATNRNITAELHIESLRNDLGYFQSQPNQAFMGMDAFSAPNVFTARVLKESPMKALAGTARLSKGFLLVFKSGHVGMVQRVIGSNSQNKTTFLSKRPRWRTRDGRVEKLQTMGSPSAAAMHTTIWPQVEEPVEQYLADALMIRTEEVIQAAARKAKARR